MKIPFFLIPLTLIVGCGQAQSAASTQEIVVGPPSLNFTEFSGCSDIAVLGKNREYTEILMVEADRATLNLSGQQTWFSIEDGIAGLHVYLEQSNTEIEPMKRFRACDDQGFPDVPKPKRWEAVSGKVGISVVAAPVGSAPDTGRASIILKDVKLQDPKSGEIRSVEALEMKGVAVGWFPG